MTRIPIIANPNVPVVSLAVWARKQGGLIRYEQGRLWLVIEDQRNG